MAGAVGMPAMAQVGAGAAHRCAVGTDGTVHCWGDDLVGQSMPPSG
ncbi:MAG: hypothetical protein EA398_00645 [Deltaproteobacteria bacterium]|nr:MAG: hypothetical protein EA398_00645 [Deltaproteobacteria bacterium]